jgi:serine phosphatase RsbU (regulator of sigma subunit)
VSPAEDIGHGERVLGELLELSHQLRPSQIPDVVRERARLLGALDAVCYVVDIDQRLVVRLDAPEITLDIDGTLAGRAFRARETQESSGDLWIPLLDGADRVGILHVVVDRPEEALRTRLQWLASITAELLVTKSKFGDTIMRASRRFPMSLAAELRWALLPPLTFRNDHVEIAGMLEPVYDVAGDAFDYAVGDDVVHVAMFDAMGHGLEATRMANLAIAAYRGARRARLELPDIVRTVDAAVHDEFGEERFVTAVVLMLDLRTGVVRFVLAGHPAPLLLRGTQVVGELTGAVNLPLGLGIREPVITEVSLEVGDRMLLFTDGVTEAEASDGEEFGVPRLRDLLEQAALSAEISSETVRRLTHSVLAHAVELKDDATLLLVGWPAAQ